LPILEPEAFILASNLMVLTTDYYVDSSFSRWNERSI